MYVHVHARMYDTYFNKGQELFQYHLIIAFDLPLGPEGVTDTGTVRGMEGEGERKEIEGERKGAVITQYIHVHVCKV